MKIPTRPTIKAIAEMSKHLSQLRSNDAICIELISWAYPTGNTSLKYSLWIESHRLHVYADTWPEFVEIYKQEVKNATEHPRSS